MDISVCQLMMNVSLYMMETRRRARIFVVRSIVVACVLVGGSGSSGTPLQGPETSSLPTHRAAPPPQLTPTQAVLHELATQDPLWGTPFSSAHPLPTSPRGFGEYQFIQRPAGNGRIIEDWNDLALLHAFKTTNAWLRGDGPGFLIIEGGYKRDPIRGTTDTSAIVLTYLAGGTEYLALDGQIIVLPEESGPTFIVDAKDDRVLIRTLQGRFYWYAYQEGEFEEADPLAVVARQTPQGQLIESVTRLSESADSYGWNEWVPAGQNGIHVIAGARGFSFNSAGLDASTLGKSQVGVAVFDDHSTEPSVPTWYFPNGSYSLLRIADATSAGQLILVDTTGSILIFDIAKRTYVDEREVEIQRWPWYEGPLGSPP